MKNSPINFRDKFPSISVHMNLSAAELIRKTLQLNQGILTSDGILSIDTGLFKGRSPKDRFFVKDEVTSDAVAWDDQHNFPFDSQKFDALMLKMENYLAGNEVFARDAFVCADNRYKLGLRIITEYPSSNLFAYNMFIRPASEALESMIPEWLVICAPGFTANPLTDGTRQGNFSIINFNKKVILIGGTGFMGEIKKGMFTVLNFLLPTIHNVFPMHCSANLGKQNDTAIFFGLSGTGKTTLSSDPHRRLIGDDEHGWSDTTIFNFEGGCYARTINLTREREPQIFDAIKFGALIENVGFHLDGVTPDYTNTEKTENGRVSYPLDHFTDAVSPSVGTVPKNIFFLTCDAYGVLPPISKLTNGQAMYYFINGYSAKIPGSEIGVTIPTSVFSSCFGAPFLPLHPVKYTEMFAEKIKESKANVWLLNTGWTKGAYGKGHRIELAYSRALIDAVLNGTLTEAKFVDNNPFNLSIPSKIEGIPDNFLQPRNSWDNKTEYDETAVKLKEEFIGNFKKFTNLASKELLDARLSL